MPRQPAPSPWTTWRERQQLSRKALALAVGVDQSTIAHIELGTRSTTASVLHRICDVLKLSDTDRAHALKLTAEGGAPDARAAG